ncbi:uncharacterized protein [Heterodontus francisci]|uniref:uncharacterized protein n=1 Tax=Heterodontus francisci TaxID=7792 RepID=UPI00355C29CC
MDSGHDNMLKDNLERKGLGDGTIAPNRRVAILFDGRRSARPGRKPEAARSSRASGALNGCQGYQRTSSVARKAETTFSSMEWMHVVIIIVVKLLLSKSEQILNFKAQDTARFNCTTKEESNMIDRIRLYLYLEELKISCNLYFVEDFNKGISNILVPLYTSVGLIPCIEIFNRTSIITIKFERVLNLIKPASVHVAQRGLQAYTFN